MEARSRRESGQVLVLFALALGALMVLVAVTADAAVMAAVAELPG